jgi:hypothetical protein
MTSLRIYSRPRPKYYSLHRVVRVQQMNVSYMAYIFYRATQDFLIIKSSIIYRQYKHILIQLSFTTIGVRIDVKFVQLIKFLKVRELYLQRTLRSARAEQLCRL